MEYPFIKGCDVMFHLHKIAMKIKPGDVIVVEFPEDVDVVKHFLKNIDLKYKDIPVIFKRKFKIGDIVQSYDIPGVFNIVDLNECEAFIQPSIIGDGLISCNPKIRKVSLENLYFYRKRG